MLKTTKLLSTLLLTITVALNAGCSSESPVIQSTRKKVAGIATDVDDVLLIRAMKSVVSLSAFSYIRHADWKSLLKGKGNFKRMNGERKYVEWMKKGLTEPAKYIRSIMQQKEIIPETLELYKKLHAQGFKFYTATNIGSIFFGDLQKKFSETFNDNFIKHCMTVDYENGNPIEKPDPRYFKMLEEKINPADDEYILYIDDKEENVKAAEEASQNIKGIVFINAKQLEEDLKNLYGITL